MSRFKNKSKDGFTVYFSKFSVEGEQLFLLVFQLQYFLLYVVEIKNLIYFQVGDVFYCQNYLLHGKSLSNK